MYWNRFIPAVCNVAPIVLLEIEDHQIHRRRIYATDAMSESAINLKAEQYKLIKVTPFKRMCQQPQSIPHLESQLQQPCVVNHTIPFIFSRISKNFVSRINLHLKKDKKNWHSLFEGNIYHREKWNVFVSPENGIFYTHFPNAGAGPYILCLISELAALLCLPAIPCTAYTSTALYFRMHSAHSLIYSLTHSFTLLFTHSSLTHCTLKVLLTSNFLICFFSLFALFLLTA